MFIIFINVNNNKFWQESKKYFLLLKCLKECVFCTCDRKTSCAKFHSGFVSAIRKVVEQYSIVPLPSVPYNNAKTSYGRIQLQRTSFLFDLLNVLGPHDVESESPLSMELVGQVRIYYVDLAVIVSY